MVDVLIAGAGPAGCVAAIALARAGARVLLVDRARFPRDKLCGDTLNPGTLRVLGRWGLRDEIERASIPLTGMVVTGEGGVAVPAPFGAGLEGRALSRRTLDALLLRAAIAARVQVQDRVRVTAPLVDEHGGQLRVRGAVVESSRGTRLRLPATVTIAADGRQSSLAFALGLARQPARPRRWAIGAYYADVDGLGQMGEMHIRAGHYIGVAPLPGGVANVCLVSPAGPGFDRPAALLAARVASDAQLAPRFERARRVGPVAILGPLAVDASAFGLPGLLLAGDAAGFVDPMTGDGLRFALRGAELAADVAAATLLDPDIDIAQTLAESRARAFGRKMRVNRALRAFVASSGAVRAAAVGARLAPAVLRALVRYEADVREARDTVAPVFREPALATDTAAPRLSLRRPSTCSR